MVWPPFKKPRKPCSMDVFQMLGAHSTETILSAIGGVICWGGKKIIDIMKGMSEEIKELKEVIIKHDERLKVVQDDVQDHENRIRSLEHRYTNQQ